MLKHLNIRSTLDDIIRPRKGEVKLGERFRFLEADNLNALTRNQKKGLKFVLIGIPESVGILANHGVEGAENSWQEFLYQIVNQQSNRFVEGSEILCLGQIETRDLQSRAMELNSKDDKLYTKLRSLCQELDNRVAPVIESVVNEGLVPIVIGGGHNNAYPILQGACHGLGLEQGMGCINLDAHADFRPLEGRHSGNAFSYAFYKGYLQRYHVTGINSQAISEAMLKNIDLEDRVEYILHDPENAPNPTTAIKFINQNHKLPIGLEIDLDVLSFMPASAYSVSGYSMDQVMVFINQINQKVKPVYLHLAEGQIRDPLNDARIIGKSLTALVLEFIKSYPR
jgi:formiminoglutamase